jgi:hypothetical protein
VAVICLSLQSSVHGHQFAYVRYSARAARLPFVCPSQTSCKIFDKPLPDRDCSSTMASQAPRLSAQWGSHDTRIISQVNSRPPVTRLHMLQLTRMPWFTESILTASDLKSWVQDKIGPHIGSNQQLLYFTILVSPHYNVIITRSQFSFTEYRKNVGYQV